MGAIFAPTRFSLVRISIQDLVADRKSLVRNSGVGGGGQNRILTYTVFSDIPLTSRTSMKNALELLLGSYHLRYIKYFLWQELFWLECIPPIRKILDC